MIPNGLYSITILPITGHPLADAAFTLILFCAAVGAGIACLAHVINKGG